MNQKEIGLYIHIPFCMRKCHYCDFSSYPNMEEYWEPYIDAVVDELAMKAQEYDKPIVNTLFIGGGTPSLIPPLLIEKIQNAIYKYYSVKNGWESTIEANPGTLSKESLSAYKDFGINRLSIGLQACQDQILKFLGRTHSYSDFIKSIELAQRLGFENINADIIFGTPNQTFSQWRDTVEKIIAFGITHISAYSLIIEDETLFGKMKRRGELFEIDDQLDRKMYHYAVKCFNDNDFKQYEISNFAKPNYICRHNMNYWRRGYYLGVGAGAHSYMNNKRFANTSSVSSYITGINNKQLELTESYILNSEDEIEEFIFLGLRLEEGIDLAVLKRKYGINIEDRYKNKVDNLVEQGLIRCQGTVIKLTKKGLDFANRVILDLV